MHAMCQLFGASVSLREINHVSQILAKVINQTGWMSVQIVALVYLELQCLNRAPVGANEDQNQSTKDMFERLYIDNPKETQREHPANTL